MTFVLRETRDANPPSLILGQTETIYQRFYSLPKGKALLRKELGQFSDNRSGFLGDKFKLGHYLSEAQTLAADRLPITCGSGKVWRSRQSVLKSLIVIAVV